MIILYLFVLIVGIVSGMLIEGLVRGKPISKEEIGKYILDELSLTPIQVISSAPTQRLYTIRARGKTLYHGYDSDIALKTWAGLEQHNLEGEYLINGSLHASRK